ncbi:hypothetical protein GCM10010260_27340 [Streptomyces filipinensis]|uniref:Uncharacterized protein n=1 Tax=Streptomyces filipinensis TaxID=66887 RepID=A0A918I9I0_9ACTN|nr:hypothetical protein [Streptomyces filipinensis]GGU91481.1 hypothetical protein GCM10010260_27340 [Streptomyces filipinensis]
MSDLPVPTRSRMVVGWLLVVLLAAPTTSLLGALDAGLGGVLGAITLLLSYHLIVRRLILHRNAVPRRVKVCYALASIALAAGAVYASPARLVAFGKQGVGSIDYQDRRQGSHGTYMQCYVQDPDGNVDQLPSGGACPHPEGTPVTMVYSADGIGGPLLGSRSSYTEAVVLCAAGELTGYSLMVAAAVLTVRRFAV